MVRCPLLSLFKCTNVPYTEQQLREILQRHDLNGDKVLSKEELRRAFADLKSRNPGYRVGRALSNADANGDGCISEEEMEALVKYVVGLNYVIKA